jgi:ionotropic glutamate receptor
MAQAGLFDYWELLFRPVPPQCQENIKTAKPVEHKFLKTKDKSPALTLKNMTGAFIVLLFGLGFSFLTFLCELIISFPKRHTRRFQKAGSNSVNANKVGVNGEMENDIQEINKLNESIEINQQPEPAIKSEKNEMNPN